MARPTVSVIIPSHNHRSFLVERLQSILLQTEKPGEIIVIDDGSMDGSAAWWANVATETPLQLELRPKASGNPFEIWNAGAANARSDYLWIAESDDNTAPDFLAILLEQAQQNEDAPLIFCQSELIDAENHRLGTYEDFTKDLDTETWRSGFVASSDSEIARLLLPRNTIPNASACLIRRSAWDAIGGAETSLRLAGDWITYARLLTQGPIVFVPRPLNRYRFHGATQRSRTVPDQYVRESYLARAEVAHLHKPSPADLELARRYARWETEAVLKAGGSAPNQLSVVATAAALAFDPLFLTRGGDPALQGWERCELFCHPQGSFSEENKRLRAFVPGFWQMFRFHGCVGQLRVDPMARRGRVLIRSIRAEGADGKALWSADQRNEFAGLKWSPSVRVWRSGEDLLLEAADSDPQIFLPLEGLATTGSLDVIVELMVLP